jgi:hypothetical protein
LITISTICDIFENQGGYLILAQSTSIEKAFNSKEKIIPVLFKKDYEHFLYHSAKSFDKIIAEIT